MAFMNIFNDHVVQTIHDLIPRDVSIRVRHRSHFCSYNDYDEYVFRVPVGTTVLEIKEGLLDQEFGKFGWTADELNLWFLVHPDDANDSIKFDTDECPDLDDDEGEFHYDALLHLILCYKVEWEESDDDDESGGDD